MIGTFKKFLFILLPSIFFVFLTFIFNTYFAKHDIPQLYRTNFDIFPNLESLDVTPYSSSFNQILSEFRINDSGGIIPRNAMEAYQIFTKNFEIFTDLSLLPKTINSEKNNKKYSSLISEIKHTSSTNRLYGYILNTNPEETKDFLIYFFNSINDKVHEDIVKKYKNSMKQFKNQKLLLETQAKISLDRDLLFLESLTLLDESEKEEISKNNLQNAGISSLIMPNYNGSIDTLAKFYQNVKLSQRFDLINPKITEIDNIIIYYEKNLNFIEEYYKNTMKNKFVSYTIFSSEKVNRFKLHADNITNYLISIIFGCIVGFVLLQIYSRKFYY